MDRLLYAAAPSWSGIKHRFVTLNHVGCFANHWKYRVHFLWGVSEGVGYCRFEDLLSPISGVKVLNVSETELNKIEVDYRRSDIVHFRGEPLVAHRPGAMIADRLLAFDLWGDFAETSSLKLKVPIESRPNKPLTAAPARELQVRADAFIRKHNLRSRVGIRVRVTENPADGRTLCRIQRELD